MIKKSEKEKWEPPEVSLDVNDNGDVSIIFKICKISCHKRQILLFNLSIINWLN